MKPSLGDGIVSLQITSLNLSNTAITLLITIFVDNQQQSTFENKSSTCVGSLQSKTKRGLPGKIPKSHSACFSFTHTRKIGADINR